MEVGELWMTGEPGPGSLGDLLRAKARERSVPVRVPGPETRTMGGARVEVLRSGWSAARSFENAVRTMRPGGPR